jgi:hypothetical protein
MSPLALLVQWANGHGLQILASLAVWATLVLGVAWLLTRLLRRSSSAVRYCVWQLGLTGLLILPVLCASVPGIPLGFSLVSLADLATTDDEPSSAANIDVSLRPMPDEISDHQPPAVSDEPTDFDPRDQTMETSTAVGATAAADRSPHAAPAMTTAPPRPHPKVPCLGRSSWSPFGVWASRSICCGWPAAPCECAAFCVMPKLSRILASSKPAESFSGSFPAIDRCGC